MSRRACHVGLCVAELCVPAEVIRGIFQIRQQRVAVRISFRRFIQVHVKSVTQMKKEPSDFLLVKILLGAWVAPEAAVGTVPPQAPQPQAP